MSVTLHPRGKLSTEVDHSRHEGIEIIPPAALIGDNDADREAPLASTVEEGAAMLRYCSTVRMRALRSFSEASARLAPW